MWRQKLYAFLIRRILGPYLSKQSNLKLEQCMEYISLQEGLFVLKDIEFDSDYVSSLLQKQQHSSDDGSKEKDVMLVEVLYAKIDRLTIDLSMSDCRCIAEEGCNTITMSTMYSMGKGGSSMNSNGTVALVATIELEGIHIGLRPACDAPANPSIPIEANTTNKTSTSPSAGGGGIMSSIVESALHSLRLTLKLNDLHVRLYHSKEEHWMEMSMQSLCYTDVELPESSSSTTKSDVLHKRIDFESISIHVGTTTNHSEKQYDDDVMVKTEGKGHVNIRVVTQSPATENTTTSNNVVVLHDIEMQMKFITRVSLHCHTIRILNRMYDNVIAVYEQKNATTQSNQMNGEEVAHHGNASVPISTQNDISTDAVSSNTLDVPNEDTIKEASPVDEFMRKYTEARHYARTREVRGGILLPSNDHEDDDYPSFDAFFDCNSTSFSHYLSVLHHSTTHLEDGEDSKEVEEDGSSVVGSRISMKFHLYVAEMELRLHFNDAPSSSLRHDDSASLLSIVLHDVNITSNSQSDPTHRTTTSFTFDLTSLDVQHIQSNIPTSFIRFHKEMVDTENAIVTTPPNLFISFYTRMTNRSRKNDSSIDIDLQPMEIVLRPSFLSAFHQFYTDALSLDTIPISKCDINPKKKEDIISVSDSTMKVSCTCSQIIFILPLDVLSLQDKDTITSSSSYDILFKRKRYYKAPFLKPIPFLLPSTPLQQYTFMSILDGVHLDLHSSLDIGSTTSETTPRTNYTNTMNLQSISFCIVNYNNDKSSPLVMNLFGCESEPHTISNDSIIKIQYSNTQSPFVPSTLFQASSFPIVPPLSTMKASQPDHNSEEQQNKTCNTSGSIQTEMLQNVNDCDRNSLDVSIPFCIIDLTIAEIHAVIHFVSRLKSAWSSGGLVSSSSSNELQDNGNNSSNGINENDPVDNCISNSSIISSPSPGKVGVSLQIDQLLLTLQENIENDITESTESKELKYTYVLIFDGVKAHSVIHTSDIVLCHFRIISRDVTLYEGKSSVTNLSRHDLNHHLRPKKVASKVLSNLNNNTTIPIFYRNNLSCPLSVDTPAFHLDVIRKNIGTNIDSSIDFSVHLFVYDMVYRYPFHCKWVERLSCWFRSGHGHDDTSNHRSTDEEKMEEEEEYELSDSYVIAFFATISDCMIDYTPPLQQCFQRPSRLMIRISEIRASSNFVTATPSIVQAYKVSIADLVIYLCNQRYPYNIENSRLSCCRNVLAKEQMDVLVFSEQARYLLDKVQHESSLEEVLDVMNFVSVLNLDSMDCFFKITSLDEDDLAAAAFYNASQQQSLLNKQAHVTADVTFGHLSLSVCKDSFSCLVDTCSQWLLRFTSMSKEEIRLLKQEAAMAPSKQLITNLSQVRKSYSDDDDMSLNDVNTEIKSSLNQRSKVVPTNGNHIHESKNQHASTLFDLIDENMFKNEFSDTPENGMFKYCKTSHSSCKISKTNPTSSEEQPNGDTPKIVPSSPFSTIPDNELSASELRKKHGVIEMDDVATALAQSLLIKNFYTVDTTTTNMEVNYNGRIQHIRKEPFIRESNSNYNTNGSTIHTSTAMDNSFDWTTVDWKWSHDRTNTIGSKAEWYEDHPPPTHNSEPQKQNEESPQIHIFPQHIPKIQQQQVADLFFETGTMNAAKFANQNTSPPVNVRVLIKDLTSTLHFFDGLDWEEEHDIVLMEEKSNIEKSKKCRKAELMRDLLDGNTTNHNTSTTTNNLQIHEPIRKRRYHHPSRSSNRYIQCFFSGLKMRIDTFSETPEHQLASIMKVSVSEFFLAETISNNSSKILEYSSNSNKNTPNKMIGEWVNDLKHPRDYNDGILMMKTVTMRPACKVSSDGKIMSDESLALLELLPLRCKLNQAALRFLRNFFAYTSPYSKKDKGRDNEEEEDLVGVFFREFRIKSCQLKVDYHPIDVDIKALREGNYIEVLNVFPLEDMELVLDTVEIKNICGWGTAFSDVSSRWMDNICETQMYKFFTDATPFHTITTVGGGMINLALIPFYHRNNNASQQQQQPLSSAYKDVTQDFASTVALETLNTTSKVTKYMAEVLNKAVSISANIPNSDNNHMNNNVLQHYKTTKLDLPTRPNGGIPHNVADTVDHAIDSITRGLRTANYTILVLPRKEYQRNGTSGAITSFVRAVPVAVLAPLSGASEALSYLCVGVRNQMRPDVRREEEAFVD